jgi:hypothetical protein
MTPRKRTIDDLDDIDDEDGILEEEVAEETDLDLRVHKAEDLGLGGNASEDQSKEQG